ncbi:MAG: ATP-binding protein [Dehalococcoidales bacterium]|nr:ATP-binding protein [Dehalococcoidales bacterium]
MKHGSRTWVSSRLVGYVVGLATVAVISGLIGLVSSYVRIANVSMLYLTAVLAAAVVYGRGPAVLVSLSAFLVFDWFFTQPEHTFTVADPAEWVALLLFLATAVATGHVAAGERRRAMEAEQREREAAVLYDFVRLMNDPDLGRALCSLAERLRSEFALDGVAIDIDHGRTRARATAGEEGALEIAVLARNAPAKFLGEGRLPTGEQRGTPGRWVRIRPPHLPGRAVTGSMDRLHVVPIRIGDRQVGQIALMRSPRSPHLSNLDDRLLSTVAAQMGTAVENTRLRQEAIDAEVLRRTDELKSALLNAVSHDLRTPLSSIIASASSLRQQDVAWTEEDKQEFAAAIEEEALRLNQIVGNLLDLSRIEGGTLRPEKGWYDLGALIDNLLGRLRPLVATHPVKCEVDDGLPPVFLDYVEIDQVLSNLVENAAKYTPAGTEITVSAKLEGDNLRVEVVDRGPGVPPADSTRLFEPFYRPQVPGPRPKGTGMGLAVAKGLVEAHGGRIWVSSREGGGARFVFTLPIDTDGESVRAYGGARE